LGAVRKTLRFRYVGITLFFFLRYGGGAASALTVGVACRHATSHVGIGAMAPRRLGQRYAIFNQINMAGAAPKI